MTSEDSRKKLMSINSQCAGLAFIGEGSLQFLNNLLISNLTTLPLNCFNYSALCNPKGRVISSMWINITSTNEVFMIIPKEMQENLLHFFNLRKFRQKIEITAAADSLYLSKNKILRYSIPQNDALKDNIHAFYAFFQEQNLPWISELTTEKFIPQHINLDQHENILSFSKGCYPGQEIVARIKYLGKIKKRMKCLKFSNKLTLINACEKLEHVSPLVITEDGKNYQIQVIDSVQTH